MSTFPKKITLLNETVLKCLNETNERKIIKAFSDTGIKVLEANFAFVWFNSFKSDKLQLAYKSKKLPYKPKMPTKGGRNYKVMRSFVPDFVVNVKKTSDATYVSRYMKSFVIIPISYKKKSYGSMVFCFKKIEKFPSEKRILSLFMGNIMAQTITVHRFEEKSKKDFISNATHEFRTPLAVMRGNIDLALLKKSKEKKLERVTLKSVRSEIDHLSEKISELTLILSKKVRKNNL